MLKKFFLILLPILLLYSCQKSDAPATRKSSLENPNILRFDVPCAFTSLDPTSVDASGSVNVFPLLYSFLFVPNAAGNLEPDLATSWRYDATNYTWTISLRKDALFHDGRQVTAGDVRYSIAARIKHRDSALAPLISDITCRGDHELIIKLRRGDSEFCKKIWEFSIVPAGNATSVDYYNKPIGSGPFKFSGRVGRTQITLVKNESYYGCKIHLDGIRLFYGPDKVRSWKRLLAGETDLVQEVVPDDYRIIKTCEKDLYLGKYLINFNSILLYNCRDPLFRDYRVRQALTMAINRQYLVDKILKGFGIVACGALGCVSPYHNPQVKPFPYDSKKASELLAKAGWTRKPGNSVLKRKDRYFEFTALVQNPPTEILSAECIKLWLSELGIKMNIVALPSEQIWWYYFKKDKFEAALIEMTTCDRTPERLLEYWGGRQATAGLFFSSKITHLLRKAVSNPDTSERLNLFHEIDTVLSQLQPASFLFQKLAFDAGSKRFVIPSPFSLDYEGTYRLKYAYLASQKSGN